MSRWRNRQDDDDEQQRARWDATQNSLAGGNADEAGSSWDAVIAHATYGVPDPTSVPGPASRPRTSQRSHTPRQRTSHRSPLGSID